jgi:hypothetical protein
VDLVLVDEDSDDPLDVDADVQSTPTVDTERKGNEKEGGKRDVAKEKTKEQPDVQVL